MCRIILFDLEFHIFSIVVGSLVQLQHKSINQNNHFNPSYKLERFINDVVVYSRKSKQFEIHIKLMKCVISFLYCILA